MQVVEFGKVKDFLLYKMWPLPDDGDNSHQLTISPYVEFGENMETSFQFGMVCYYYSNV
jgi:hypothetical protein